MASGQLEIGIIFLFQTGVGILGNSFLLCFYSFMLLTGHRVRPTDLILNQLVLANSLVLFSKGIPQTISAFGMKYFLGNIGCKIVFYSYRVATGVSISTVCLLSGFHAVKIDSTFCRWMALKFSSLTFIRISCFLCWIPHILINSFIWVVVNGSLNNRNQSREENSGDCSWPIVRAFNLLVTLLYFFPDILSLGLIVWVSSSTVFVLHIHKKQIQNIRSPSLSHRPSHEVRAIRSILILASSICALFSVYIVLTIWMTLAEKSGQWTVDISVFVASCFPAYSPFVLIASDTRVSQFCLICRERKK